MKMKRTGVAAAVLTAAVLMTGCMFAYRTTATLEPSKAAVQPETARFNIAAVEFVNPTNIPASELPNFGDNRLESAYDLEAREQKMPDGSTATAYIPVPHQRHRAALMEAATKLYPQLFSAEAAAIPIKVTITRSGCVSDLVGHPCISCLTLTLLPLRGQCKTDYTVRVLAQDEVADKVLAQPVVFSRISQSSSSCFIPSGWLPVSGPKVPKLTGDAATRHAGQLTINGCVEAVVQALRRVEPGAWERLSAAKR